MTRGELAKRAGCHAETVRYYEKAGLMPEPPRTSGGHRVYDEGHQRQLCFVLRGRNLGFSLDDLRGLLTLVEGGGYTCAEVREISLNHLATIRSKIADLQRLEQTFSETVARCDGETAPECPVIDALFEP